MRLELSRRLELEEPGKFARGGNSPFVKGLPIGEYEKIAPVKIGLVDTSDLIWTDLPGSFDTIYNIQRLWEESILNSLEKDKWDLPLISPPIVDKEYNILDGNHRSAAAAFHSSKMFAILVENNKDLDSIAKLVKKGLLWWPHGKISYKRLMNKRAELAEYLGFSEYVDKLEELGEDRCFYQNGNFYSYFEDDDQLLRYGVSRAIHQNGAYFLGKSIFPSQNVSLSLSGEDRISAKKIIPKIREVAKKSPLVRKNSTYSVDDVVQDVLGMLRHNLMD